MKSRWMTAIITAAAVVVAGVVVMAVMFSPAVSPLASVHDADGDGYPDSIDAFPDNASEWSDLDGDGVGDNSDAFPSDASEWTDSDGDGVGNNTDAFPEDPTEWADSDGDGVGDNTDAFPEDPTEWTDSDGDGVGDNSDAFPEDPTEWTDSDGDSVGDNSDAFPEDPEKDTPSVTMFMDMEDTTMIMFIVDATDLSVPWSSIIIAFTNGYYSVSWHTTCEGLTEPQSYWDFGSALLGDINLQLLVGEYSGDGIIGALDAIAIISPESDISYLVNYTLTLTYEPTMKEMGSISTLWGTIETPTLTLGMSATLNGYKIDTYAVESPVNWSDIVIILDDGILTYYWYPSSDVLGVGTIVTQHLEPADFITFDVFLNVTDLAGNGVINTYDFFTFTAGNGSWEDGTTYTVTLMYIPTGGIMGQIHFIA